MSIADSLGNIYTSLSEVLSDCNDALIAKGQQTADTLDGIAPLVSAIQTGGDGYQIGDIIVDQYYYSYGVQVIGEFHIDVPVEPSETIFFYNRTPAPNDRFNCIYLLIASKTNSSWTISTLNTLLGRQAKEAINWASANVLYENGQLKFYGTLEQVLYYPEGGTLLYKI